MSNEDLCTRAGYYLYLIFENCVFIITMYFIKHIYTYNVIYNTLNVRFVPANLTKLNLATGKFRQHHLKKT